MYDVAIIGGGVICCAIARELSRYQIRTVVLEMCAEVGFGTTKTNSGIIHAGHHSPPDTLKGRLVVRGNELFDQLCSELNEALAEGGRSAYRERFMRALAEVPGLVDLAPVILYRTLGPHLPAGMAPAAVVWGLVHQFATKFPDSIRRAGFEGPGFVAAEKLFDAIMESPSGVVYAVDEYEDGWSRVVDLPEFQSDAI